MQTEAASQVLVVPAFNYSLSPSKRVGDQPQAPASGTTHQTQAAGTSPMASRKAKCLSPHIVQGSLGI